ncbi:MAG: rod shape-determining protein RodA [Syntrophales bacterium]|jgi:rod shape determining protein RodA|nr:rod shape-determining protein RodA [Syntrophales bacterium]MDY0044282.1 rod shape-determining protein RodA [Syntrophales bacterium]
MKIDRRVVLNFEWVLPIFVLSICAIGLVNLYSAGHNLHNSIINPPYMKQIYWIMLGTGLMILAFSVDYHVFVRYGYLIYGFSILLLLAVFLYGHITNGSQRWLVVLGFSFQPSELVKLTMIIALTKFIDEHKAQDGYTLGSLLIPFCIVLIPSLLILKQPDLGTALFLMILFFSIVLFVGVRKQTLAVLAGTGIFLLPLLWIFMKDYQKERLLTFLNPELDPLGSGYHIIQSMIAVGSGGITGKGFLKGTQSQLKFLPEQQTDFVFSVFAEEWGFLGGMILIVLFIALILWGFRIGRRARDLPGLLIAYGASISIFWAMFINIGMVLGLLPVVGIPLPFLSYGGSSLVVLMISAGLMMNVSMRRFVLQS